MRKAPCALAIALVLVATSGLAASKISGNLAPVPSDCFSGPDFCKNGLFKSAACAADNSDCTGATLAKAKLSLKDTMQLKVSVSKLADNDGTLITTTPGTDTHVLKLSVNRCIVEGGTPSNCANPRDIYVKLDYVAGKAKAAVDLSLALADPSLTAIAITSAQINAVVTNLALCPGTNSAADIAGRVDDTDCDGSVPYMLYGIVKP